MKKVSGEDTFVGDHGVFWDDAIDIATSDVGAHLQAFTRCKLPLLGHVQTRDVDTLPKHQSWLILSGLVTNSILFC